MGSPFGPGEARGEAARGVAGEGRCHCGEGEAIGGLESVVEGMDLDRKLGGSTRGASDGGSLFSRSGHFRLRRIPRWPDQSQDQRSIRSITALILSLGVLCWSRVQWLYPNSLSTVNMVRVASICGAISPVACSVLGQYRTQRTFAMDLQLSQPGSPAQMVQRPPLAWPWPLLSARF